MVGTYTAEMSCGGDTVSRTFKIAHGQGPDLFFLDSGEVEAGGSISVMKTYQAEMKCGGQPVHQQFVVKAKPRTPIAEKPADEPKAKAPIVKPKGAPQTGGGATA